MINLRVIGAAKIESIIISQLLINAAKNKHIATFDQKLKQKSQSNNLDIIRILQRSTIIPRSPILVINNIPKEAINDIKTRSVGYKSKSIGSMFLLLLY